MLNMVIVADKISFSQSRFSSSETANVIKQDQNSSNQFKLQEFDKLVGCWQPKDIFVWISGGFKREKGLSLGNQTGIFSHSSVYCS